jgi:hypothetical protein
MKITVSFFLEDNVVKIGSRNLLATVRLSFPGRPAVRGERGTPRRGARYADDDGEGNTEHIASYGLTTLSSEQGVPVWFLA